jgi:hypothetical protein
VCRNPALAAFRPRILSKAGFKGQVTSTVLVEIAADGHATSAQYVSGNAPDDVQKCMIETGKAKTVSTGPGQLRCELMGTVFGENLSINSSPSFTKK